MVTDLITGYFSSAMLPEIANHTFTSPLRDNEYYVLLPIAQGLTVSEDTQATVTELLITSKSSFSKIAGYNIVTYEKEEGDIDGPFDLDVALTENIDEDNDTNIIWVTSSLLLDEKVNM